MTIPPSKIAILGSSSRLSRNWVELAPSPPLVISSRKTGGFENPSKLSVETSGDLSDLKDVLQEHSVEVLVNSVAMTSVEECAANPELASSVNVLLPETLATICHRLGVKLVHVSTDHVSDGRYAFLKESSETSPLNEYGVSKLRGEERVLHANDSALVIRTNFFGTSSPHRKTFSDWLIDELRVGHHVEIFADVFFTPIYAETLIRVLNELLASNASGIVNVAATQRLSKFEFAMLIAEAFNLDSNLIRPIRLQDRRDLCKRPLNMGLDTSKLEKALGSSLPTLSEQINHYAGHWHSAPTRPILSPTKKGILGYGGHSIDETDILAVSRVLRKGPITQGGTVEAFERAVADHVQAEYAVAVSSGTAGLHLAMLAAEVNSDSLVTTSPISFVASANCAQYVGATVDFQDIDTDSLNLSPRALADCPESRAHRNVLVPVHFAGLAAKIPSASELPSVEFDVVIEDAAHALGALQEDGFPVGSCTRSDMAVFSLHPVKSITTGEGGVVTTNSADLYRQLIRFRSHGINKGSDPFVFDRQAHESGRTNPWYYEMQSLGFNYRLTDIQAALGISQLEKLNRFIDHRRLIAQTYDTLLAGNRLIQPAQESREGSAHHLYPVRIDYTRAGTSRAQVMDELKKMGIGTQVHYIPIPLHPFYSAHGYTMDRLPNASEYYAQCLSLPIHMGVSTDDVRHVVNSLNAIVGSTE